MPSPKVEEKIAAREQLILDHATALLSKCGWSSFTMDGILSELSLSRGTLYKHFSNREDLGVAVLTRAMEVRAAHMSKAAVFPGNPRLRYILVILSNKLFDLINPVFHQCKLDLMGAAVEEKASSERIAQLTIVQQNFLQVFGGIIRDAIAQGQLSLEKIGSPEQLAFAVWSSQLGIDRLIGMKGTILNSVLSDPAAFERSVITAMLDGYGWAPLSDDYEYDQEVIKGLWELYPKECKQVGVPKQAEG